MEVGTVAVRVEVSWKMQTMRMKEVGFKKGITAIAIAVLDSMKYMRSTRLPRDWLQKNRQAGIGVAGDMKQLRNQNQPPSCLD
jgi:hypothetical protein